MSDGVDHAIGRAAEDEDLGSRLQGRTRPAADDKRRPVVKQRAGAARSRSMPRIRRISMTPCSIDRQPLRRLWRKTLSLTTRLVVSRKDTAASVRPPESATFESPWRKTAKRRRLLLMLLVLGQTIVACWSLAQTFPRPELSVLEAGIIANFALLFAWISFSFWSNVLGFLTLWRKAKFFCLADTVNHSLDAPVHARTAVLMPICNEDPARCFAGIAATYKSLAETGRLEKFDFFVLSDTAKTDRLVDEEIAWVKTCKAVNGFGRIFYRHRRNNIKRKSGNIADFLRRWGRDYEFMIVLDADSVMSGEILVRLVQLMERHPRAGIIQTVPAIFNGDSLYARVQQFSSRCYGSLFSAALHSWQLGESYYWGHNAIIRVEPFIKHCGLARLPGQPPFGGEILSHDFVEAALMGRAGWEVWLAWGLAGSYEESPPSLLDELKRDRRWCQGNLQHLRFFPGDRIRTGHRAIFCIGFLAYASALLWFSFLILNTIELVTQSLITPIYFSSHPSLFPIWPAWHPEWAIALLSTTALLLFLPKILSLVLILKNREAPLYGGLFSLSVSMLLETVLSTLLAPVRMWFHSKFVLATLAGKPIKWNAQCRTDHATGWLEAIRAHGISTLFAFGWMIAVFWVDPVLTVWLMPVAVSLLLSIPLSVYTSRIGSGRGAGRWLLRIPEESVVPPVIETLREILEKQEHEKFVDDGWAITPARPLSEGMRQEVRFSRTVEAGETQERNRDLQEAAPGPL